MRAIGILRKVLKKSSNKIHKSRMKSLNFAVEALLVGGKLSLTGIGRSATGSARTKHNIKRVDRLLGNYKLHAEMNLLFRSIAGALILPKSRPIILVDWTKIKFGKFASITAAIPIGGRALPIYWQVYEFSKYGNPQAQRSFLDSLAEILPETCKPIIVTDAGFRNPWFSELSGLGWDWVGRVGISKIQQHGSKDWIAAYELYDKAGDRIQDFGICGVARKNRMEHRVILGKRFVRNPSRAKAPRRRTDRGRSNERTKARNKVPWILVTSLTDEDAASIQGIYAKRMSIEECYRDTKNHRFGWSFEDTRASTTQRYTVLLMLASLAMLVVTLVGMVSEQKRLHLHNQANTVRKKRVLSFFYLGKQILRQPGKNPVKIIELRKALTLIQSSKVTQLA